MARKPRIDPVRWQPPPVDPLPDMPAPTITVVPLPGNGPEDDVVDTAGQLWTGLEDGRIVRIPPDGGEPTVIADTGGRPLGLHIARDGRVLICDSHRGLLALDSTSGTLDVLVESVAGRRLKFCSNVTETPDGTIYFTESTCDFGFEHFTAAVVEARGRGALFRLDADGTATTLVDGLYFANGLTPTADGSALVFAETQARRLSKYWLTGPHAGSVTPLAVHLPGMPDNLSTGADGRIWTAMVAQVNTARSGQRCGRRWPAHHASGLWRRHRCGRGRRQTVDGHHQLPERRAGGADGHQAVSRRTTPRSAVWRRAARGRPRRVAV